MSMSASRRIPEAEWQKHKAEIQKLYIKDGKSRKDVMTRMAERHGFQASKEQYVRQFKKWNFSKNTTNETWKIIDHKIQKRNQDGKGSDVYLKGKQVPQQKLKKELGRNPYPVSNWGIQNAPSPAIPEDVMVCTPQESTHFNISLVNIPWFGFQARCLAVFQLAESSLGDTQVLNPFLNDMSRGSSDQPNEHRLLPYFEYSYRHIVPASPESIAINVSEDEGSSRLATHSESWNLSSFHTSSNAIQAVLFMSSNNLLTSNDMNYFLRSMINSSSRWVLKSILLMKTPTTEIFAANLLLSACSLNDTETASLVLSIGADANVRDEIHKSPLHYAIQHGNITIARALIKSGANINPRNEDYVKTAMTLPNPYDMVQLLLHKGAVVQEIPSFDSRSPSSSHDYFTRMTIPLQIASNTNDLTMLRLLLTKSRVVDVQTRLVDKVRMDLGKFHYTDVRLIRVAYIRPLVNAAWNGNIPMMTALLEAGANLNVAPDHDWTINGHRHLHHFWLQMRIRRLDWSFEELTGFLQQRCYTALQAAAHQNDVGPVRFLLEAGAAVDTYDNGDTALQIAAKCGNIPMVHLLCSRGADIYAPAYSFYGRTVMQAAAESGSLILMDLFLELTTRDFWSAVIDAPPARCGGRTALQAAAENGHIEFVHKLLRLGADINGQIAETHGITVFQAAVKSGKWSMVILVLAAGACTNTPSGTIAGLAIAIEQNNTEMLELLLHHGGDNCIGIIGLKPTRPLWMAEHVPELASLWTAEHELEPSPLVMTQARFDVNETLQRVNEDDDVCDTTALDLAIRKGQFHAVKLLLQAGADATRALANEFPSVDRKMLMLLLEHGADPNLAVAGDGFTPLAHWIKFLGRDGEVEMSKELKECILLLLNARAEGNCSSVEDWTQDFCSGSILGYAAWYDSAELVQILLAADADPNWRNSPDDDTTLALAAQSCDEIFYLLLNVGADINAVAGYRLGTALEEAVSSGKLRRVQDLLNCGADVNVAPGGIDGKLTALQRAVDCKHEHIMTLLIKAGANINAPASLYGGRTALQIASEGGSLDLVRMLLQEGADVNAPPSEREGFTALQGASISGHFNIAVVLLKAGANINGKPSKIGGRTALEGAAEHGRLDIVHLLLENDNDTEGFYDRCENAAIFAEQECHIVIARILRKYRKV